MVFRGYIVPPGVGSGGAIDLSTQTLLIPVEFPDPEPLPATFIGGFTTCRVTLLGLYETPEDLDEDERHRREIEAYHTLYTYAAQFVRSGDTADVELVMGPDVGETPTRGAEEGDFDALLVPNPINTLSRILVPVRDRTFAESIGDFVGTLDEHDILHTTLFHVAEAEEGVEEGARLLASVRDELADAGVPGTSIDTEVRVSDDPAFPIGEAASGYDLIIMGETEASGYERVFGRTYESVADATDLPIVVVRE